MDFIPHVIDGQETGSASGETFESVDPWTREPYADVALGSAQDADRGVRAARRAFDDGPWPRMGFAERGALLHRFAGRPWTPATTPTPGSSRPRTPRPRPRSWPGWPPTLACRRVCSTCCTVSARTRPEPR